MKSLLTTRELIAEICNADSLSDSYRLYQAAVPILNNAKFVFASSNNGTSGFNGGTPGFAINRTFSNGAAIRSIFNTDKVVVFDEQAVEEMMRMGTATYPMDYSISLDTQAISYLEPFLNNRTSCLPKDFEEVFDFISRKDVFIDPVPYAMENHHNLTDSNSMEKIFWKWKAYETLRTLDTDHYKATKQIRSILPDATLSKHAQEFMARMLMQKNDRQFARAIDFEHKYFYCLLLEMAFIQLKSDSQTSPWSKIQEFIDFGHSTLGVMSWREIAIAHAYFHQGQNLRFFGKIQIKKPRIFEQLDNMAWDLWHVRQLERSMTLKPSPNSRYFFPALLTFDKRLVEIIDIFPLKACAHIPGENEPIPFYDGNPYKFVANTDDEEEKFRKMYYSSEAVFSRAKLRASVEIYTLIKDLEQSLKNVAMI